MRTLPILRQERLLAYIAMTKTIRSFHQCAIFNTPNRVDTNSATVFRVTVPKVNAMRTPILLLVVLASPVLLAMGAQQPTLLINVLPGAILWSLIVLPPVYVLANAAPSLAVPQWLPAAQTLLPPHHRHHPLASQQVLHCRLLVDAVQVLPVLTQRK
jgi:hypothetical protein